MAFDSDELDELFGRALRLPEEARAALAGRLLESLEATVDTNAEDEWSREIASRLEALDRGEVKPVSWSEARQLILGDRNGPAPS